MDRRQKTVLLFLVSTFIMFMCPGETQASCGCPTFWTAYNDHCYRLFIDRKTWHEAEEFCNQFSVPSLGRGETARDSLGHLVSINSPDENDFVTTYYKSTTGASHELWLGCHDTTTEGTFKWTDRSPFNFNMWSPDQPDNSGSAEDCGEMKPVYGYKWNDARCDETAYFMCEMPIW